VNWVFEGSLSDIVVGLYCILDDGFTLDSIMKCDSSLTVVDNNFIDCPFQILVDMDCQQINGMTMCEFKRYVVQQKISDYTGSMESESAFKVEENLRERFCRWVQVSIETEYKLTPIRRFGHNFIKVVFTVYLNDPTVNRLYQSLKREDRENDVFAAGIKLWELLTKHQQEEWHVWYNRAPPFRAGRKEWVENNKELKKYFIHCVRYVLGEEGESEEESKEENSEGKKLSDFQLFCKHLKRSKVLDLLLGEVTLSPKANYTERTRRKFNEMSSTEQFFRVHKNISSVLDVVEEEFNGFARCAVIFKNLTPEQLEVFLVWAQENEAKKW